MKVIKKIPGKRWNCFPENVSETLEEIGPYPENNFRYVPGDSGAVLYVFCLYMRLDNHKIYYDKREMSQKYVKHLSDVGKSCQSFDFFNPDRIDWGRVKKKFTNCVEESARTNVDTRTSFKFGNKFLVKSDFTFGQRTVPQGKCHVYQTKDVPILLFLMPRRNKKLSLRDGYFPLHEMQRYDRRILLPNWTYRIPSGVTYVLYTVHKAYFSLDVMSNENFERHMSEFERRYRQKWKYSDPVMEPVRKLPKDYYEDQPAATPYIEYEERDEFEQYFEANEEEKCPPPSQESNDPPPTMAESVPNDARSMPLFPLDTPADEPIVAETQPRQQIAQPLDQIAQPPPQQIMLYMIPQAPSVFEKEVVVACPEFTSLYQKLTRKEYGDPNWSYAVCSQNFGSEDEMPLDMSYKEEIMDQAVHSVEPTDADLSRLEEFMEELTDLVESSNVDQGQMDETIQELLSGSPFSEI